MIDPYRSARSRQEASGNRGPEFCIAVQYRYTDSESLFSGIPCPIRGTDTIVVLILLFDCCDCCVGNLLHLLVTTVNASVGRVK